MITRPKFEDYGFPKSENELEQFEFYTGYLEDYCDALEKALDDACEYIHNDGIDGCPNNYDGIEMKECKMCHYECISLDDKLNSNESYWKEYLKKSMKCWKEYFLRGDAENE